MTGTTNHEAVDRATPHQDEAPSAGRADRCDRDVCVTCSDQAVPMTVVALHHGDLASADTGSGIEEVSVALVEADVGSTVLVHAGEAIAVVGS